MLRAGKPDNRNYMNKPLFACTSLSVYQHACSSLNRLWCGATVREGRGHTLQSILFMDCKASQTEPFWSLAHTKLKQLSLSSVRKNQNWIMFGNMTKLSVILLATAIKAFMLNTMFSEASRSNTC